MNEYNAGDRVEIVRESGRDLSETFGIFLPKGTAEGVTDAGRITVRPDGRSYTLNVLPDEIRPLDA